MYEQLDPTLFGLEPKHFALSPEHCSMEAYERYGARSDSSSGSRAQRLDGISAQQKLPSFRDIIPQHLHNAIDPPQTAISELQSPDPSNGIAQPMQQMSRSVAPSPVPSQPGSMPIGADGYEDFTARGTEAFYLPTQQARSDHSSPWVPSVQYPEISTTIVPQPPMYSHQQVFPTARTSPGLPPPREAQPRPVQNGFEAAYGMPVAQYPSIYSQTPTGHVEVDPVPLGSRRTPHLESNQRLRQPYPPMNRHYSSGTMEYPRYATTHFDPYRATTPYQGSYAEVDYPAQAMNGAQHSNFGALGDSMDSRSKRRRGNLPKQVTDLLKEWLHAHLDHPYPSEEDKQFFISRTGLSISQISNWFINARRRQVPSIRSNRDRSSNNAHMEQNRTMDRLLSHDPSLSPR